MRQAVSGAHSNATRVDNTCANRRRELCAPRATVSTGIGAPFHGTFGRVRRSRILPLAVQSQLERRLRATVPSRLKRDDITLTSNILIALSSKYDLGAGIHGNKLGGSNLRNYRDSQATCPQFYFRIQRLHMFWRLDSVYRELVQPKLDSAFGTGEVHTGNVRRRGNRRTNPHNLEDLSRLWP